jgi:glycosyltransferase involved in cell wall biosynthesis
MHTPDCSCCLPLEPAARCSGARLWLSGSASDIPANLEIGLPHDQYFPLGDRAALSQRLRTFAARPVADEERALRRSWVAERYDWRRVAAQTLAVYRDARDGVIQST